MPKRPNIVFVFPDEWRAQALGFLGQDPVLTPHLDAFAAQSRVLTHAVANLPICSPYRAMLLTGKYPHSNGVLTNCNSAQPQTFLRPDERCLSDVLHDTGYSCGYIGKWHLEHPHAPYVEPPRAWDGNVWDEWTAPERRHGFQFWHSYGAFDHHFAPHYWATHAPRESPLQINQWSPRHETDVAIEYLRNRNGQRDHQQPFALFVSMNPPHMPFHQVPPEYVARYGDATPQELLNRPNLNLQSGSRAVQVAKNQVKNYFAACTGVDEQFGRILAALEAEKLADDTIVIFTSDHGEMMGSHDLLEKTVFYEESFGVPFLIRWPHAIAAGPDDLLLSTPDILPTVLGLAGLSDHIPPAVEGRDLAGALRGENGQRPDSALYLRTSPADPCGGARGVRTHRFTFVIEKTPAGENQLLFDRQNDPYQLNNVAASQPAQCRQLTEELHQWLRKTGDPWLRTN